MTKEEIIEKIKKLNETELERCLNVVLSGIAANNADMEDVIISEDATKKVIKQIAEQSGVDSPVLEEDNLKDRSEAIREVLIAMTEDDELKERVASALDVPQQLIAITTALVLAGIVVALSTSVEVKYKKKDGKAEIEVNIIKPSTSDSILGKFFGLFSGGA